MTLPTDQLTQLVRQHGSTLEDNIAGGYEVVVTEAVWRASGSLKATGSTDEEALAQARFLVDGLTELAGRLPSATIQLGAYSDRDDDEATWRGTFSVVFPLRDAS